MNVSKFLCPYAPRLPAAVSASASRITDMPAPATKLSMPPASAQIVTHPRPRGMRINALKATMLVA